MLDTLIGKLVHISGVGGPFTVRDVGYNSLGTQTELLLLITELHDGPGTLNQMPYNSVSGIDHCGRTVRVLVTKIELKGATVLNP
jgi:hypothetical protein